MSEQNSGAQQNRPTRKIVRQNPVETQSTEDLSLETGLGSQPVDKVEQETILTSTDPTINADGIDNGSKATEKVNPQVAAEPSVTLPRDNGPAQPLEKLKIVSSRAVVYTRSVFQSGKLRYDALSPKTKRNVLVGGVGAMVLAVMLLAFALVGGRKDSPSTSVPDSTVSTPSEQPVQPEP